MFDPPPQQLQSVGDLIGRAVRLYRKNYKLFFHVLLWPTVFLTAGKVAFHWGLVNITSNADMKDWSQIGIGVVVSSIGMLALLIVSFVLQLKQLAFIRLFTGVSKTYEHANSIIMQKKWRILGMTALSYFALFAIFIFWISEISISLAFSKGGNALAVFPIIGIVFGITGFAFTLTSLVICMYIAMGVFANENITWKIFSRIATLFFSNFWRSIFFFGLLSVTVIVLSYPLSLPLVSLSLFEFIRQGLTTEFLTNPNKMPLYFTLLNQVWESVISMITWPVVFIATGLFYYDTCMRSDGIDLLDRLQEIADPTGALNESVS